MLWWRGRFGGEGGEFGSEVSVEFGIGGYCLCLDVWGMCGLRAEGGLGVLEGREDCVEVVHLAGRAGLL